MLVLTVELVPSTCWGSNVRTLLRPVDWGKCKRFVRERSGDQCEICGGRGPKWPVECHEIWRYDLPTETQVLDGLLALCPTCHGCKHFGYSESQGRGGQLMLHMSKVNQVSLEDTTLYLSEAFELWRQRSYLPWGLDLSYLLQLGITPPPTDRERTR